MDLEIDSPHLLGMLSPLTPHRALGGPCPLSLRRCGSLQPLLSPEPLHSFFSPSSLRDAAGGEPPAGPCRYVQLRSCGADVAPLHFSSVTILAGCCGFDPPHGRPSVLTPGNDPAGQQRPAGDAPGLEVSVSDVPDHHLLQLIQLLLLRLHPAALLPPTVIRGLTHLDHETDVRVGLALDD